MEKTKLHQIIKDAAFEVRKNLYSGYLESVYQNALVIELKKRGLSVSKEVEIPVLYKNEIVGNFRADIIVENSVILEIKAAKEVNHIHEAQLVNYLTATGYDYGFLINYGSEAYRIILKSRIYSPNKT